jgi:outer membrane murein-binding lipoprotein Lpp
MRISSSRDRTIRWRREQLLAEATAPAPSPSHRHREARAGDARTLAVIFAKLEEQHTAAAQAKAAAKAAAEEVNARFEEFWSLYPRKVGKIAARKAWAKAVRLAGHAAVIEGLRAQSAELAGREPQFCPHPATWLNRGSWADEPEASYFQGSFFDDEPPE